MDTFWFGNFRVSSIWMGSSFTLQQNSIELHFFSQNHKLKFEFCIWRDTFWECDATEIFYQWGDDPYMHVILELALHASICLLARETCTKKQLSWLAIQKQIHLTWWILRTSTSPSRPSTMHHCNDANHDEDCTASTGSLVVNHVRCCQLLLIFSQKSSLPMHLMQAVASGDWSSQWATLMDFWVPPPGINCISHVQAILFGNNNANFSRIVKTWINHTKGQGPWCSKNDWRTNQNADN